MKAAGRPVKTSRIDLASVPLNLLTWVELITSMDKPCSYMEIFNSSGSVIKLAQGAAASEVAIPYLILPNGSNIMLPINIGNGVRISAKAIDIAADSGALIFNFFD